MCMETSDTNLCALFSEYISMRIIQRLYINQAVVTKDGDEGDIRQGGGVQVDGRGVGPLRVGPQSAYWLMTELITPVPKMHV